MTDLPASDMAKMTEKSIGEMGADDRLSAASRHWLELAASHRYSHNFLWLGRPVIQVPQDLQAVQELIWECRPDVIVETGVAHGGSLVYSASLLALLDLFDAKRTGSLLDPTKPTRRVVGVDIDIRKHNREAIVDHPLSDRIVLVEGSSTDPEVVQTVREAIGDAEAVLVMLDSNHTHDHVLSELNLYAPLTSVGSYCVVFDTAIEFMPDSMFSDRPWAPSNSPWTAVEEFLRHDLRFVRDQAIDNKLQISVAPGGYLRRLA